MAKERRIAITRYPRSLQEAVPNLGLLLRAGFNYWEPDYVIAKEGETYTVHVGQRISAIGDGSIGRINTVIGYQDRNPQPQFFFGLFDTTKSFHQMSSAELESARAQIGAILSEENKVAGNNILNLLAQTLEPKSQADST